MTDTTLNRADKIIEHTNLPSMDIFVINEELKMI